MGQELFLEDFRKVLLYIPMLLGKGYGDLVRRPFDLNEMYLALRILSEKVFNLASRES